MSGLYPRTLSRWRDRRPSVTNNECLSDRVHATTWALGVIHMVIPPPLAAHSPLPLSRPFPCEHARVRLRFYDCRATRVRRWSHVRLDLTERATHNSVQVDRGGRTTRESVSERACERANRERARARSLGYARVDSRLLSLSRSLPLLPSSSLPHHSFVLSFFLSLGWLCRLTAVARR